MASGSLDQRDVTPSRSLAAPPLPADVVEKTSAKYMEAFKRLTGASL